MSIQSYSINEALTDPKRVFGTPENLVSDPRLDRGAKLEVLRRWLHDASALSTASNEGMDGDEPSMLHRVQQTIDRLTRNGH